MVVLGDAPTMPPGFIIQIPEGKPFNVIEPVLTAQLGWTTGPSVGAAGPAFTLSIATWV